MKLFYSKRVIINKPSIMTTPISNQSMSAFDLNSIASLFSNVPTNGAPIYAAAPIIPMPVSFKCPCCNNTYSDRVKYGKEFNGEWFCNDTCNTMYKTRQRYATQFAPQCNTVGFLTANPVLVPVFPLKAMVGRYSSDGITFVF